MTILGIRQFQKKYNKLLRTQKIIYDGRFYTLHNILDIAGFVHKMICTTQSLNELLVRLESFIKAMIKNIKQQNTGGILYIVFDPIVYLPEDSDNPYKNIKQQTIQQRNKCTSLINGMTIQQITQIKKHMYFYIKELFGDTEGVQIIVSKLEADIMIGSLIKQINQDYEIGSDDLTIISTDCDMCVIGYGYKIQDGRTITDTVKFFKLFGLEGKKIVCCVPQCLTCDYNPNDKKTMIETLYEADLKPEGIIFDVFYSPELGEDDLHIQYEKKNWLESCQQLYDKLEDLPMYEQEQ